MKHKYTLDGAKLTGRPPEIEVHAYNAKEDFERANIGIVTARGRRGRIMQPISDRVYLIPKGEGELYFGGEEGREEEAVRVEEDDVVLISGVPSTTTRAGCGSSSPTPPPTNKTPTCITTTCGSSPKPQPPGRRTLMPGQGSRGRRVRLPPACEC